MRKLPILGFVAVLLFTQCQNNDQPQPQAPVNYGCAENPVACELVAANNKFGFNLFQRLHQEEPNDNIFISPLSINTALSMTSNGAAGDTREGMKNTMEYLDLSMDEINNAYQYVLTALPLLDPHVQMYPANSIWYEKTYPVKVPFLNTNQEYYDSDVNPLDFKDPNSVNILNGWVNDKTKGKIPTIIDEISPDAIMYLINAIYFKGEWRKQFDEDKTIAGDFYKADGTTVPVHLMNYGGEAEMRYFENDKIQAVDLPYADSVFSMSLLLPKENYSLDQLINDLQGGAWNDWQHNFSNQEVVMYMPRFKMEYEKVLNDHLIAMGMDLAFRPGFADFSNIADDNLFISLVKHKSFVEVNEVGTEAAAVTIVGIETTSVPQYVYVSFNRPFIFLIRENKSNGVLFLGKMMEPSEE